MSLYNVFHHLPMRARRMLWPRRHKLGLSQPNQPFRVFPGAMLECNTWDLGDFVWQRLLSIVGTRPYPPHELMLLGAAVLWLQPQFIIEWGTHIGASARVFHELNVHYGIRAKIHSIDLPDTAEHIEHPHEQRGRLVRGLPVELHQGDGPLVAASILRDSACRNPLVFIDGDHAYTSVLRDARLILDAAPRANLLFHDTFWQPTSSYNHGPYEAVQEVVRELRAKAQVQVVEASLGCPGMTLVLQTDLPSDKNTA